MGANHLPLARWSPIWDQAEPRGLPRADRRRILWTLAHELAHHWQKLFGKPVCGRYHNREWADMMETLEEEGRTTPHCVFPPVWGITESAL